MLNRAAERRWWLRNDMPHLKLHVSNEVRQDRQQARAGVALDQRVPRLRVWGVAHRLQREAQHYPHSLPAGVLQQFTTTGLL